MSPQPVRRLGAFAVLLVGLFLAGLLIAPHGARALRDELSGLGAWGPIAAVAAYVLLTCAMAPGPVLAGACGLLFGAGVGTAVAIVSATLGASAAFLIARRLARAPYGALAGQRLQGWTARIGERGFVAVLYARIAPGAPFALLSYAAGMTRIRLREFAAATAIGASPRAFAYAALGGSLADYSSPQALVAIGVLLVMTLGGAALLWRSRIAR
ncbi:MAG: TVP38/TMEM64 family protein [Solirubrobacteraceae bacterium]